MAFSARQNLLIRAYLAIASKVGPWTKAHDAEGASYADESINAGKAQGFACRNCAFWRAPAGCAIVKGAVQPQGLCRLYVIPAERLVKKPETVAGVSRGARGRIQGETL